VGFLLSAICPPPDVHPAHVRLELGLMKTRAERLDQQNADANTLKAETGRQNAETSTRQEDRLTRADIQLEHPCR
jgi:hypothetical protein